MEFYKILTNFEKKSIIVIFKKGVKMEKISKFFIIVGFILFSCKSYKNLKEEKNGWQIDPNLRLLAKPVSPFKLYSDPVWSPSGKIYYLASYGINYNIWVKQALKVIKEDGTGDRILLEGEFQCLDISPDYDKLIIGTNDGRLLLVDTVGNLIAEYKTHEYFYGSLHYIYWVKFGCEENFVYYGGASGSMYRMNLKDTIEEFVSYNGWVWEPICRNNSGFQNVSSVMGWPAVCPFNDTIYVSTYFGSPVLADPVPNGKENEYIVMGSVNFPDNWVRLYELKPYEKSTFYRPNFSFDGKSLIFSAYDARFEANPNRWWDLAEYLELWIYENFDKLIDKYSKK